MNKKVIFSCKTNPSGFKLNQMDGQRTLKEFWNFDFWFQDIEFIYHDWLEKSQGYQNVTPHGNLILSDPGGNSSICIDKWSLASK